jgi:hypothetical protein
VKLTLARITALKCPEGKKDMLVFDDEQKGLGVRVTASGGKTYLCQYALAGRKRRVPLGSCSAITLAAARMAAQGIMGNIAQGRDPAAERKKAAAEAYTLGELLQD